MQPTAPADNDRAEREDLFDRRGPAPKVALDRHGHSEEPDLRPGLGLVICTWRHAHWGLSSYGHP
eukprot:7477892-Prorocentrum_lima.AAC.1